MADSPLYTLACQGAPRPRGPRSRRPLTVKSRGQYTRNRSGTRIPRHVSSRVQGGPTTFLSERREAGAYEPLRPLRRTDGPARVARTSKLRLRRPFRRRRNLGRSLFRPGSSKPERAAGPQQPAPERGQTSRRRGPFFRGSLKGPTCEAKSPVRDHDPPAARCVREPRGARVRRRSICPECNGPRR